MSAYKLPMVKSKTKSSLLKSFVMNKPNLRFKAEHINKSTESIPSLKIKRKLPSITTILKTRKPSIGLYSKNIGHLKAKYKIKRKDYIQNSEMILQQTQEVKEKLLDADTMEQDEALVKLEKENKVLKNWCNKMNETIENYNDLASSGDDSDTTEENLDQYKLQYETLKRQIAKVEDNEYDMRLKKTNEELKSSIEKLKETIKYIRLIKLNTKLVLILFISRKWIRM